MRKPMRLWLIPILLLSLTVAAMPGILAAEKPVVIRTMADWAKPTYPQPEWAVWKEVEKRLNIKLIVDFVPSITLKERVATMMASGDLPDAVLINLLVTPAVYDWTAQGAFQPVDKHLKKYAPHLWKGLAPGAVQLGTINGKMYGVPRPRATARDCFAIRKDWLDKLKLKVPRTTDELENVMRQFVTKDPDGNGKNDTVGFGNDRGPDILISPFLGLGKSDQFVIEGGQVKYNGISAGAKEGLAALQRWYKEGLIDPDLVVFSPSGASTYTVKPKAAAAKVGVMTPWLDQLRPSEFNPVPQFWQQMRNADPKANWVMVPVIASPQHPNPQYYQDAGTSMFFFVPAAVKDPKKIEKLFKFWDFWASNEGYELGSWGVKGIDYTEDASGNRKFTAEGQNRIFSLQCFRQTHLWEAQMQIASDTPANNKLMTTMLKDLSKYTVPNPFVDVAARSKTYVKYWPDLYKLQMEAYSKIMIGQQPVSYFDTFVKEWRQNGGDELMKELNELYAKK